MTAKTAAQRKADERERYRREGLVRIPEMWVRPEVLAKVRKYIAKLHKENAA